MNRLLSSRPPQQPYCAGRQRAPSRLGAVLVVLLLLAGLGGRSPAHGQPARPFEDAFYPPRLVMRYQSEINLTATQRDSIQAVYARAQSRYHRLDLDLQQEMQALRRIVRQTQVDAGAAQVQLDSVLAVEDRLKRIRLQLMVTVKNLLTPEQQTALDTLRAERQGPRRRPRR